MAHILLSAIAMPAEQVVRESLFDSPGVFATVGLDSDDDPGQLLGVERHAREDLARVSALVAEGKDDEALRMLNWIIRKYSGPKLQRLTHAVGLALIGKGEILWKRGQHDEAIRNFRHVGEILGSTCNDAVADRLVVEATTHEATALIALGRVVDG